MMFPKSRVMRNPFIYWIRHKSSLRLWNEDINTEIKLKIEKYWANEVSYLRNKKNSIPFYVLPMFPYPSGNLHMGHVRVYSISDAIARIENLSGKNVIHPIGWDAFGLPAENAAIERNIPPHQWTKTNIDSMKEQLYLLGYGFNWEREISTCDPNYYKWTQYIFLKLFEKGLAYQNKAEVNWDPVDKTVLADEQVDELGCSWRSGAKVERKHLTQWFIKTTKYAKKLYDGLGNENLENWKDIINLQKHWIGECDGIVVKFIVNINGVEKPIDVWTNEPYKLIHGQFLTMNPTHVILHNIDIDPNSIIMAINPITNTKIPVYITDNVPYPEGRDVYVGCPTQNKEDSMIAHLLNVSFSGPQHINFENENQKAIDAAISEEIGGYFVSSKLKDWLISRQRYWGTPIPIIYCDKCGTVPVPYEDLPVKLPELDNKIGIQTLSNLSDWVNCKCPKCQSDAKRETDTMDTFVDSSWYFYRFLDPNNKDKPFDKEKLLNSTPVNIYIGGKEHAVLHLYYARFMSYFLHSLDWTYIEEPFRKLVVQGMVMGQSYKLKYSGKYIPVESVDKIGKEYKERTSGEPVVVQWEKMSKSKYNGENPKRLLGLYGCDTTRLLMLADVPPATPRRWSDATLPGVLNWQRRLWMTVSEFIKYRENVDNLKSVNQADFETYEEKIWNARNYFTATATYHFKYTHKLSVGISRLQSLTSTLRNNVPPEIVAKSKEFELALAALIIMVSPITPHFCSELWAGMLSTPYRVCENTHMINWEKNVLDQGWPTVDDHYELSVLCKVDGADRCDLKVKASDLKNLTYEKALQLMLSQESVQERLKHSILRTKYEWYPDCRAIFHIYTSRNQKAAKAENVG